MYNRTASIQFINFIVRILSKQVITAMCIHSDLIKFWEILDTIDYINYFLFDV